MASWNSTPMEVLYNVLGWIAFCSWSISFYPQVILNFRRKRYICSFLLDAVFFCSNSIILAVFDDYLIMVVQRSGLEF